MTSGRRLGRLGEPRTLAFAVRLGLLGFCFVVAALDAHPRRTVAGAIVLVLAAAVAYLPSRSPVVRRLLPTLEACIAAGAVIAPPSDRAGLLPYLLAPAFAAGLMYGLLPAITATGMAAFVLLAGHLVAGNATPLHTFAANSSQWVLLALAVGLLTAWIRRLAADSPSTDQNRSYEAAYDLLSQLRTVSRQLAGGLDAGQPGAGVVAKPAGRVAVRPRRRFRARRGWPACPACSGRRQLRRLGHLARRRHAARPGLGRDGADGRRRTARRCRHLQRPRAGPAQLHRAAVADGRSNLRPRRTRS